jgi:lipopolysaccharide/colanic/teichoic acid biosynthesis glycosyltransferase
MPAATAPAHPVEGALARFLGRHVSPHFVALWCAEVVGCGVLLYLLLLAGLPAGAEALRQRAADQAALLALTIGLVSVVAGLYSADLYLQTRRLAAGTVLGILLALPALWAIGRAVGIDPGGFAGGQALLPLAALAGWTLLAFGLRLAFGRAVRANLFVRRLLVVGADPGDPAAARLVAAVGSLRPGRFQVVAVLPAREAARLTPGLLRQRRVWAIVLTDSARRTLPPGLLRGWRVCGDAAFWEDHLRRVDIDRPGAPRHPGSSDGGHSDAGGGVGRLDAALNRAADIALALALLLLTLPLMALTALLIPLDSPGPVLYRQERVGLHGRPFILFKFRSMRTDAEARGPVWAVPRDPRVTRIGAFIRLSRIDELPQLFNVLRGEMGFIGPRPERPHFVAQLAATLPLYRERSRVKPGLTGWAQVNYRYGASVEDARVKLSYDLYYVKHRSPALAVQILLATVWVVLFQKGAR